MPGWNSSVIAISCLTYLKDINAGMPIMNLSVIFSNLLKTLFQKKDWLIICPAKPSTKGCWESSLFLFMTFLISYQHFHFNYASAFHKNSFKLETLCSLPILDNWNLGHLRQLQIENNWISSQTLIPFLSTIESNLISRYLIILFLFSRTLIKLSDRN